MVNVWFRVLEVLWYILLIILYVINLLFIVRLWFKYCLMDFLWLCCLIMIIIWEVKCNLNFKNN